MKNIILNTLAFTFITLTLTAIMLGCLIQLSGGSI